MIYTLANEDLVLRSLLLKAKAINGTSFSRIISPIGTYCHNPCEATARQHVHKELNFL